MDELELTDDDLEAFPVDGFFVPLIRETLTAEPPKTHIDVGAQGYDYDRSFPLKGYSAVMPSYLREQMGAGRKPLLLERPTRYYVYFAE